MHIPLQLRVPGPQATGPAPPPPLAPALPPSAWLPALAPVPTPPIALLPPPPAVAAAPAEPAPPLPAPSGMSPASLGFLSLPHPASSPSTKIARVRPSMRWAPYHRDGPNLPRGVDATPAMYESKFSRFEPIT